MTSQFARSTSSPSGETMVARSNTAPLFLTLTTISAGVVFWLIYTKLLLWRGPFVADEGVHALKGIQFADDLQKGDWLGFTLDSYRQVLYPPLHSWVMAAAYLLAGPSVLSAGTVGLLCFVAMAPILFLAAYLLHKQEGNVAGVVAAVLLLSSPLLIEFSTQIMREVPGLFTICLTILAYIWLVRNRIAPPAYALLALGIIATYFVRMPYGVLTFAGVLVARLLDAKFNPSPLWKREMLYLILPLLIVFIPWFAYPPKLISTWQWLQNEPNLPEAYAASGWLFYPVAIFQMSASTWHFLLALISVALCAVSFWRDQKIRFLLVMVLVVLAFAEFHPNKQQRHIFPLLPALYLLSGFGVAEFWRWARTAQLPVLRWLPPLLTVALVLYSSYIFFGTLRSQESELSTTESRTNSINATNAAIANVVRETGVTLIIGSMDMENPTPAMLDWYLVSDAQLMETPMAGSLAQVDEEQTILARVRRLPLPAWLMKEFERVLTRSDTPNKSRTLYVELPIRASYSQSQKGLRQFVRALMTESKFDGIVVITVTKKSAKYPLAYFAPGLEAVGLQRDVKRTVHSGNVQIDVYKQ